MEEDIDIDIDRHIDEVESILISLSLDNDNESATIQNKRKTKRKRKRKREGGKRKNNNQRDFLQIYSPRSECQFTPKKGKCKTILYVGLFHVLNGPLSLSKVRHYWGVEDGVSVKSLFTELNKTGWNRFTLILKLLLKVKKIQLDCITKRICDDYFPTNKYWKVLNSYNKSNEEK